MPASRNLKVDSLSSTYASYRDRSGEEVAVEVVGAVDPSDLLRDIRGYWEYFRDKGTDQERLDNIAKAMWLKYNVLSLHLGYIHHGVADKIRHGWGRSFLLEGDTKPEGTVQTEFTTRF